MLRRWTALAGLLMTGAGACAQDLAVERIPGAKPRNVVFILIDDLRWDILSCLGHPLARTPRIDSLASGGVHFRNAFVTTALCSPSRASILTGQYMHHHGIIDNNVDFKPGITFFPQYLQKAGYATAFIGKWHMGGHSDDPRPGFDRWVSFKGQGNYLPTPDGLNVDGRRVPQKGYITDELTDYALDWLDGLKGDRPFFLYLSHKAVHGDFVPAERHLGKLDGAPLPETFDPAAAVAKNPDKPLWVKNQVNSWHGVEFAYHKGRDLATLYRRYGETLMAVDESVGRVLDRLEKKGLAEDTLVLFMGDNGFLWGEHGLIDKRNAYDVSMRVPLLGRCPSLFPGGTRIDAVVGNIDIGPTILEAAGLRTPKHMDGRSFLGLGTGAMKPEDFRKELFYEYYWEWNFPHTPTVFALRGPRYKFIQYHGVWDTDELYDLQEDPHETTNLIRSKKHGEVVEAMRGQLYQTLESSGAARVPVGFKRGDGANLRSRTGPRAADFPEHLYKEKEKPGP